MDVDAVTDSAGRTLLMVAALANNVHFVRAMLTQQIDLGRTDDAGLTALDHARAGENDEIIALLEGGVLGPESTVQIAPGQVALGQVSSGHAATDLKVTAVSPVGLSFVPPISVFQRRNSRITGLSLDVPYGFMAEMYGIQLGGFHNVRGAAVGMQVGAVNASRTFSGFRAGGLNVSRASRGIEVGAINITSGLAEDGGCYGVCVGAYNGYRGGAGLIAGGLFNVMDGSGGPMWMVSGLVNGAQSTKGLLTAPVNYVQRDFVGLELAIVNFNNFYFTQTSTDLGGGWTEVTTTSEYTAGSSKGVQISGMNFVDNLDGAQVGVLMNGALGVLHGAQISAINLANLGGPQDSSGLQLGGLNFTAGFNIARELHGVQLGGLNFAYKSKVPFTVLVNAG